MSRGQAESIYRITFRVFVRFVAVTIAAIALFGHSKTIEFGRGGTIESIPLSIQATAINRSTVTACAEEDNINIPLEHPEMRNFLIQATHPDYVVGIDNCAADFTNCAVGATGFPFEPTTVKLFDDGITVLEAVRESEWWRPTGMDVTVDGAKKESSMHYIRIYRKIEDVSEWPQILALYQDGNLRLKPQPPVGSTDNCFGTSVIIGPAAKAIRPIAEIAAVDFNSVQNSLTITYISGATAFLAIFDADRTSTRVYVEATCDVTLPCATIRSMFVARGNADVDQVTSSSEGVGTTVPIEAFSGATGTDFLFSRSTRSTHNTSAPDLRVFRFEKASPLPVTKSCFIATAAYGSYLHKDVQVLRAFRDSVLLRTDIGAKFVGWYYEYSPQVAAFISKSPGLRLMTRIALTPLVYAIKFPFAAMGIFICSVLGLVWSRRAG
jgi:hypothetical protein